MSAGTQEGRGEISMQAQHDASWDRLARAIGDIGERPRSLSAQTELSLAVTSLGSVTKTLLSRLVATGQERDTLAANLTSAIRAAERIATQHGETQAALTAAERERDEAVKRLAAAESERARVAEVVSQGDGWWKSCSGCHETVDGAETGYYPHSATFNCHVGGGCGDCGGIGVVWESAAGLDAWCAEQAAEMSREQKLSDEATALRERAAAMEGALKAANLTLARAFDRIHSLPRSSDTALADEIEATRGHIKDALAPQAEAGEG